MSKTAVTIILLAFATLLTGCGSLEKLITRTEYVVRPTFDAPLPEPVTQQPLEWHVITMKNLEAKLKELRNPQGEVVIFALTPEGYQSLSMNAAELRRYIESLRKYIDREREYYNRPIQPSEQPQKP